MNPLMGRPKILVPLVLCGQSSTGCADTIAPTITWQYDHYDARDLIAAAYSFLLPLRK